MKGFLLVLLSCFVSALIRDRGIESISSLPFVLGVIVVFLFPGGIWRRGKDSPKGKDRGDRIFGEGKKFFPVSVLSLRILVCFSMQRFYKKLCFQCRSRLSG